MRALLLALFALCAGCYASVAWDDDDATTTLDDDDAADDDDDLGDDDTADDDDAAGDSDGDGVPDDADCAPLDPSVFPGAAEVCDGADQDCDGAVDEGLLAQAYTDADGDGWGDPSTVTLTCAPPPGSVALGQDCDDTDPAVFPTSTQLVDGLDSDCDGARDWLVTLHLSVDDDFQWCLDDESTLQPGNTSWPAGATFTAWLPSGRHVVGIHGWDTGYVITAAIAHVALSNGTTWVSDGTWRYDPAPSAPEGTRAGWCGVGFDDSAWQFVNVIGPIGTSPWGSAPSAFPPGSAAQWIWDHYPVNLNTQYLRKEIVLP